MSIPAPLLKDFLPQLNPALRAGFAEHGLHETFPAETELLREGQYVKVVPLVIKGLLKVFTRYEDRELLLYYIQPGESCIMSFSASLENSPSKIYASTEEETELLLLPVDRVANWRREYPDINTLFFNQFTARYSELLDTIHHLLFDQLDVRLINYLKEKVRLTRENPIKITHKQIATELGTSREVISRLIKKLEKDDSLQQQGHRIYIREM